MREPNRQARSAATVRFAELLGDELRDTVWPNGPDPVSEEAAATYALLSLALDRASERLRNEASHAD